MPLFLTAVCTETCPGRHSERRLLNGCPLEDIKPRQRITHFASPLTQISFRLSDLPASETDVRVGRAFLRVDGNGERC